MLTRCPCVHFVHHLTETTTQKEVEMKDHSLRLALSRRHLLALAGGFALPTAEAQSESAALTSLKMATMDLPPYGWIDDKGSPHGALYELCNEIGKRSGLPYVNKIQPFARMLESLKEGSIDMLSSQAHQQALDAGDKLTVMYLVNVIVVTKKGSDIQSLDDLKGKKFVFHRGASYKQLEGVPADVQYVSSYEQAVDMLHSRPVHAAVFSEPAYYYFMQKAKLSTSDFGKVLYLERNKEQWLFVRRGMPLVTRDRLKAVVAQLRQEDAFDKLMSKYGKPSA